MNAANDEHWDTEAIAKFSGWCRRYVTEDVTKRPDFPKPVINKSRRMRKWSANAVKAWLTKEVKA